MLKEFILILLCASSLNATPVDRSKKDWRVVGGSDAPTSAAPYIVVVRWGADFVCAGVIVTRKTVLTAAHCTAYWVKMNIVSGTKLVSGVGGLTHGVESYYVHESFTQPNMHANDIACLYLETPLIYNEATQPIQLTYRHRDTPMAVQLFGWGKLDVGDTEPAPYLQHLDLMTITNEDCEAVWGDFIYGGSLCTYTTLGEGACHGDSGGPLVYHNESSGVYSLVGLVNWGMPCAKGRPDVFCRISYFLPWIQEHAHW